MAPIMPVPPDDPDEAKRYELGGEQAEAWATAAHLSGLAGFIGIPAPLGPLLVWLIKRDGHPFVDDQGSQALNFQLSILIYQLVAVALALMFLLPTLGLALVPLALFIGGIALFALVTTIVAAVKANKGTWFRYPFTLKLVQPRWTSPRPGLEPAR